MRLLVRQSLSRIDVAHARGYLPVGFAGVSVFWDSQHAICTIGIGPRAKPALLAFYVFSKCSSIFYLHIVRASESRYTSFSHELGPHHPDDDSPRYSEERAPERFPNVVRPVHAERGLRGHHNSDLYTDGRECPPPFCLREDDNPTIGPVILGAQP